MDARKNILSLRVVFLNTSLTPLKTCWVRCANSRLLSNSSTKASD